MEGKKETMGGCVGVQPDITAVCEQADEAKVFGVRAAAAATSHLGRRRRRRRRAAPLADFVVGHAKRSCVLLRASGSRETDTAARDKM